MHWTLSVQYRKIILTNSDDTRYKLTSFILFITLDSLVEVACVVSKLHDDDSDDTDLEEVQGPGLPPVPGKSGGAGRVDAVDPIVQLHLTRSLKQGNIRIHN